MTDSKPAPASSADVIEGMREALRWHEEQIVNLRQRADQHHAADLCEAAFSCERDIGVHMLSADHFRARIAALALPDSKPDNQGGA